MWHWLPSELFKDISFKDISFKLNKRQKFLLQLCTLVLVGHVCIALLFSLVYFGYHEHERFDVSLSKHSSVLVLSPLQKRLQHKQAHNNLQKDELSVTKVIDLQTYEQQKKLPKKQEAQATVSVESKDIPVTAPKDKVVEKKEKLAVKAIKPTLQFAQAKDIVQPIVQSPVEKKKVEKKAEATVAKQVVQKPEEKIEQKTQEIDVDNATFVGYEQLESLTIQYRIQKSVQQHFKPPVGVSKSASCELSVQVNKQGKAQQVTMSKSSGIMVYDVSARGAIRHIEFPKEVWNKTITIVLGQ